VSGEEARKKEKGKKSITTMKVPGEGKVSLRVTAKKDNCNELRKGAEQQATKNGREISPWKKVKEVYNLNVTLLVRKGELVKRNRNTGERRITPKRDL